MSAHGALSLFLAFAVEALALEVEYERCVRYLSFDLQTKPNRKPFHSIQLRGRIFWQSKEKKWEARLLALFIHEKRKERRTEPANSTTHTSTSWAAPKSSSFSQNQSYGKNKAQSILREKEPPKLRSGGFHQWSGPFSLLVRKLSWATIQPSRRCIWLWALCTSLMVGVCPSQNSAFLLLHDSELQNDCAKQMHTCPKHRKKLNPFLWL